MIVRYFQAGVSSSFGSTSATAPQNLEMLTEHMDRVSEAMAQQSEQVIYRKSIATKHFRYQLYRQNLTLRQETFITF